MNKLLLILGLMLALVAAACTTEQPRDLLQEQTQLTQIQFISEDPEQCATLRFTCEEGFEPFNDERGCGCTPVAEKKVPVYCEEPRPEVCTREYMPVCGFNGEIQTTFGNKCEACGNADTDYYVDGVCAADLAAR